MAVVGPAVVTLLARLANPIAANAGGIGAAAVGLPATLRSAVAGGCPIEVVAVVTLFWPFGDAVAAATVVPGAFGGAVGPGHAVVGAVVALFAPAVVDRGVTAAADDLAVTGTAAEGLAV